MKKLFAYPKPTLNRGFIWSVLLLTGLLPCTVLGQTNLEDNGLSHTIFISSPIENYLGNYQDFRIPANPTYDFIEFTLQGGDGGRAKAGSCKSWGGDGATVRFIVAIGNGADQIPAGSTLRFIVGKNGQDHTQDASEHAFAGGGGGTAVFLKANGNFQTVLGVAGGGGGAFQRNVLGDCYNSNPGQGGRASESGGDGTGSLSGAGGDNGSGGENGVGGSGGGLLGAGNGGGGLINGGQGGNYDNSGTSSGGWGCGGGGGSNRDGFGGSAAGAGGGGGYSGGGGGGVSGTAGGGGSYVHPTLVFNAEKTDGGNTEGTTSGTITYQFRCYPQFSTASVIDDVYCNGSEVVGLNYVTKPYCTGAISFKWPAAGEENSDGIFGNDQPLLPGQTYEFELYYEGELVDTYTHSVSTEVDQTPPLMACSGPITIYLNEDLPQTLQAVQLVVGYLDDCQATHCFSDGSTSKTFDCDDNGTQWLTTLTKDLNGNSATCTVPVTIVGVYPTVVEVDEETVYLDENGQASLSTADLLISHSGATLCYTSAEILANYRLPVAYQNLDCDDVGVNYITLDKTTPDFPDAILELTVMDNIPITASVAPVYKTLDPSGVATLGVTDLDFTVDDNCYAKIDIISNYSIPDPYTSLDCNDIGTQFITLNKSNAAFPTVILQLTVSGGSLDLPAVTTGFCPDNAFDLTSLEDQITTASGSFQYYKAVERLYVPNYMAGTVSVIDLSDHSLITTIPVGSRPIGISVSPDGLKVYVANFNSNSVSVIDAVTNTVEATVGVGTNPWVVAVSPDGTRLYVSNYSDNTVSVINTATHTVIGSPVNVGAAPVGIAVSGEGNKVFVANQNDNTVSVIHPDNNNSVSTIAVEDRPTAVAPGPDGTEVYVTNKFGSAATPGSVSIIDVSTETVTSTVPTATQEATDLAVSPSGKIYTAHNSSKDGAINVINPNDGSPAIEVLLEGSIFNSLNGISVNSIGTEVYVADHLNDKVFVLETNGNTQTGVIPVGDFPFFYGNFYQKAYLPIDDPERYLPTAGDVISVVYDGGGAECLATTTITFDAESAVDCGIAVSCKVILEGPYDLGSTLMNDDLRTQQLIPAIEPYGSGGESVDQSVLTISGNDAIVDWVLLELRSAVDPAEVLYSHAALLQRDGDIVDLDGSSAVSFEDAVSDAYYLAVRHRNHLGIMTASAIAFSPTPAVIDFTSASTLVYGANARTNVSGAVWALFSADTDGSGAVNAADRTMSWNDRNLMGYLNSDCNLDGSTNAADRTATWNNRNAGSSLPE